MPSKQRLPKVHNIKTSNWKWMSIDHILKNLLSADFYTDDWEYGLRKKREDKGYQNLVQSISSIGFLWPALIDSDNEYSNGHHRLAACIDLGYTHVPVTTEDDDCGWHDTKGCYSSEGPEDWEKEILSKELPRADVVV